jgi:hypothetical protein
MTRYHTLGRLVSASLLLLCAGSTYAQSCVDDAWYTWPTIPPRWDTGDGSTEQTSVPDISRLPGKRYQLFNGTYAYGGTWETNNTLGLSNWWHSSADECYNLTQDDDGLGSNSDQYPDSDPDNDIADVIDELVAMLDAAYADGWRRFMLHLPAGWMEETWDDGGETKDYPMAASQYWSISDTKRLGLELTTSGGLSHWITSKGDVRVEIYGGFLINDDTSTCFVDSDPNSNGYAPRHPDPTDSADMKLVWQNVHPWFANVGIERYWMDAASGYPDVSASDDTQDRRSYFAQICILDHFTDDDCYLGGEAVPLTWENENKTNRIIDDNYIDVAPWLASHRFVRNHSYAFSDYASGDASFDVDTTEVNLLITSHDYEWDDGYDEEQAEYIAYRLYYGDFLALARAGMIPWSGETAFDGLVQHLYGAAFFDDLFDASTPWSYQADFDTTIIYVDDIQDPPVTYSFDVVFCDLDGDEDVDADDYCIANEFLGESGDAITYACGDTDGDSDVDSADLFRIALVGGLVPPISCP